MNLFSTTAIIVTRSTQFSGSAQNTTTSNPIGTPKMSVILKESSNIKVGYFGKLGFLDNQADFAEVFGNKPKTLNPNRATS